MAFNDLFGDALDAGVNAYGIYQNYKNNQATNAANQQMVSDTNAANLRIAENTNAMNAAINEANINMQREENAITRQREDNAVQRRANDLVRAGLSKTLAAGDAASANALQAPQANIAMQTGHEMKAAKNEAFKMNLETNFGNSMRAHRQLEISDRALDIEEDQLAIEREKLQHQKDYDAAVVEENKRYHDMMDNWEKAKLDQNSIFHDDAMALSWAEHELENNRYLTDADFKRIQNIYYKFQMFTGSKKLTAELAEMAARTASYLSDVNLSKAQVDYIRSQARYVSTLTGNALVERGILKAEQRDAFITAMTKIYNLVVAKNEGTTTTSSIPSKSTQMENAKDRKSGLIKTGITAGATVLGIGVAAILKISGANKVKQKLYDDFWNGKSGENYY